MERDRLVQKLVTTLHLNVAERQQLGHAPSVDEVVDVIVEELLRNGFFPPDRRPWREGEPCGDGTVIELLPGGGVRAHHQLSNAWMRPAHISTTDFPDARSAARHLVATDFSRGIDGIDLAKS